MSRGGSGHDPSPGRPRGARGRSPDRDRKEEDKPKLPTLDGLDDVLELGELEDDPKERRPPTADRGRIEREGAATSPPFRRGDAPRGLTNGVRRPANGLTNGLANGAGERARGPRSSHAEPSERINGVSAGLVNGLANARRGLTNGLTNGGGFTNGLGAPKFARSASRGKWKLYLIPLLCAMLLLLPLFFPSEPSGLVRPIAIDGRFSDWATSSLVALAGNPQINSNIDIVKFGVVDNLGFLAFYVEVAGTALQGGGPAPGTLDTVRIFLDTDGSAATGYSVQGFGADRMLEVSGVGGVLEGGRLLEFDELRDQRDWNGWTRPAGAPAAVQGSKIEAEVDMLALGSSSRPVAAVAYTQSWDGQTDLAETPLSPSVGTIVFAQESLAAEVLSGGNVPLLRITAAATRQAVTVDSIGVRILGTATPGSASALRLLDRDGIPLASQIPLGRDVSFYFAPQTVAAGTATLFTVVGDFPSGSGDTFGVRVYSPQAVGTANGTVALRTVAAARSVGYVGALPPAPRVDGGFSEWTGVSADPTGEPGLGGNPDIDLSSYGAIDAGGSLFLYADVAGRILAGTELPEPPRIASTPGAGAGPDRDRDTVPDSVDPLPLDFNNDGTPDSQANTDVDSDGRTDFGLAGGTDLWLNTTIPASFPPPYAGKVVSVYIGPTNRPVVAGEDVLRVFLDVDNRTLTGFAIGGIGADRMVEVRGKGGEVTQSALLAFAGSFPGDWSWIPVSPVTVASGYRAIELAVGFNATAVVLEVGDFWGGADSTAPGTPAFSPNLVQGAQFFAMPSSSFEVAPSTTPLAIPWKQTGPGVTATVIDPGSNAVTTQYNHQRKVVRAGDVSGDTACDATNSDGCWYAVFSDRAGSVGSDFKDGASVAVPTPIGLLDSLTTTFPSGNNLIVATIQFDNTNAAALTISAGNLELRRGTLTTDPLVSETQLLISVPATGTAGDGTFAILIGKDTPIAANPTYGIFAAASAAGLNAEVKFVIINGLASGDSLFADGGSVALGATPAVLVTQATSFPAASSSLPNIIVAAVQFHVTSGQADIDPPTGVEVRRGSTSLSGPEFQMQIRSASGPNGVFVLLVAVDAAAPANPTYDVRAYNADTGPTNAEAKLLIFRGLAATDTNTGSVAIGTSRTVLTPSISTSFAAGDDVLIGAIQLNSVTSTRTYAAGGNDIRLVGAGSGSSNEFAHTIPAPGNGGAGVREPFVRKVTTTTANPSYEGAATAPSTGSTGEIKLVAIHVKTTGTNGDDRIVLMRSSDTSGSTWGSQLILASGNSADSPLLYLYDSAEPSIAIDASGFLHVVWVSASATGDQSTLDRVRYTKTTVAYPTQSELAAAGNWEAVTAVDDASAGFMPTVSTDTSNNPHIAWSGSKTSGTVYYRNRDGSDTNRYPGTETITTGSGCGGTFPTDLQSSNNVYRCLREAATTTPDEIGAIGYKSNTGSGVNFPKQLDWTGSAWGTPQTELATAGAAVENVREVWDTASGSTLFWIALNTQDAGDDRIHVYQCTNVDTCSKEDVDTGSANDYAVTQNVGTAPERHWDIATEASSGELLLVYDCNVADSTKDLCYRTRTAGSGGTWSAEQYLDHASIVSTNPSITYITLANNPGSNRIGMGALDTTNDDFVLGVWDGTAWVNANKAVSTSVTLTNGWGGTVLAEDTADEFVAYAGNGADSMAECEWTSAGGWEATCATFDPNTAAGNDLRIMSARSLDGTDKGMVCQGDDLGDDTCWRWNGVSGTGGTRGTINVLTTNDGSSGGIALNGATLTGTLGDTGGDSVTLASWTPAANDLILVVVAIRRTTIVPSVAGNGLSWTMTGDVTNAQGQMRLFMFQAQGASPSTGSIVVTVTGNDRPVAVQAQRFSGVDTSTPVEATATNAGPPVTDDRNMLQAVATVTANAWAVGAGTHRTAIFTVPGGETPININLLGGTSGGVETSASLWYEGPVATPASTQLGAANDLDVVRDWSMIVVSVKPASGVDMRTGFDWNPDQSGTADGLVVYYANSAGSLSYNTYDDATDTWGTAATFTSAGSHKWIDVVATKKSENTNKAFVVTSNSNFDILAYRWTGSGAPANEQSITADTVDENYPYWGLAFQESPPPNYALSVRHDWSAIPTNGVAYDVCVEAHVAGAGGESMLVQVLTPPATWNTRITVTKTTDDNADQCYTLTSSEFNSGAPSIRWIGGTESGDTTQSDATIDHERVIVHVAWRPLVSWGTTYTGVSVDVSPQNNYVSLARYFEGANAEIAYRSNTGTNTVNSPKSRTWDGSTWGAESELATAGSPIRLARMARSPTSAETRIIVTVSDDGWLDAYVCTPACTVTNNIGQVWSTAPTTPAPRFDIAYEQVSGEAVLVYGVLSTDTARDIAYKTFAGGSWSAEQYLDDAGHVTDIQYSLIILASKRGSNQIGLLGGDDTDDDVNAWIWDGSAFGNFVEITATAVSPNEEEGAIAWESSSGDLLAAGVSSGSIDLVFKTFTTSWSAPSTFSCGVGAPLQYLRLKSNPLSTADDMVMATVGGAAGLSTCYWTGSAWATLNTHDTTIDHSSTRRSFDFAWEPTGSTGLLVYGTTAGQITRRTFTAPNTWGAVTNAAMGSTTHSWVQLRTNPSPQSGGERILGAVLEDTANDLGAIKWDGTTFTVVGTNTFSADTGTDAYESFDLEFDAATTAIQYVVCRDVSTSNCDAAAEFTKADGTAGYDIVATAVESASYPSLATTWDANGDLWVAYAKDVDGTTRAIYARFLDYPGATWAAAETVDSQSGTIFTRPSIGIDKDNKVHALYVATSGPQLYYNARTGGTWGTRTAIDTASDNPTLMVRAPNDPTYGADTGGLYWKTTTSETYFFYSIPEFEFVLVPILVAALLGILFRRRTRRGAGADPER